MVKIEITHDGEMIKYNSAGVIVMAIRPLDENNEIKDYGIGQYGRYSMADAIKAIVYCSGRIFEQWAAENEEDAQEIKKLFLQAARTEYAKDAGDTVTVNEEITADVEINEDLLKVITGQ